MNVAYFDCYSGIAGNMILGAFLDAGLEKNILFEELKKLKISDFEIIAKKVRKRGIAGTYVKVNTHNNVERKKDDILKIIEKSKLNEDVKILSQKIFEKLFYAEAKVHRRKEDKIHLHELSATDAIVDIVGSCIAVKKLKISKVYSSPINLGSGFALTEHGKLPVPAPATLEIVKNIPVYSSDIKEELTTPTGAAIITTLAEKFCPLPNMIVEKIGYGAGKKDLSMPNFLRVYIGKEENMDYVEDKILEIETNIDDMSPQIYDYLFEKLFCAGALDVYLMPVIMKKTRPGILLTVICYERDLEKIKDILFSETTTLGVRFCKKERLIMERNIQKIDTEFGKVRVKVVKKDGALKMIPEYEDCKKIAQKHKIPIKEVIDRLYIKNFLQKR